MKIKYLFAGFAFLLFSEAGYSQNPPSDQNAFYLGGNELLITYLMNNVPYSDSAIAKNIHGVVKLSYYVETDSSVSNITIVQDPGEGCGNAVKDLLSSASYVPAIQNGVLVRQQVTLEVPVYAMRKE